MDDWAHDDTAMLRRRIETTCALRDSHQQLVQRYTEELVTLYNELTRRMQATRLTLWREDPARQGWEEG
jgi:hypothetical protein